MFRFCDSFDHYDATRVSDKWTAIINSGIGIADGLAGRPSGRNGNGLYLPRSGIGLMPAVSKTLDYQSQWYVGFALYNGNGVGTPFGAIYTAYNNFQSLATLSSEADGTLTMSAGNAVISNIGAFPLSGGTWYYIEIEVVAGSSSVSMTVKINGNTVGSGAKQPGGFNPNVVYNTGANRHVFSGCGNLFSVIDDLYILDNQTPGLNSFLGDVKIGCIYPRADVTTQFQTKSGTGSHFSQVNEHVPDDDATYVYDNTIGDTDTYFFDNVATFTGTIPAVHLNIYARKDDEGYRAFKAVGVIQNSINGNRFVNDSYIYYSFPDDKGWSPSSVNSTPFGASIVNVS